MAARSVRELMVRITGDGAELERALSRSARRLDATGRRFQTVGKNLSLAFTAPVIAAGAAILALTSRAADYADQIDKATFRTTTSAEALQELAFAADQTGVQTETLITSLQRLARRSAEAARGNKTYADALKDLGVSATDANGELRTVEELLPDIADGFARTKGETDRVRLAFQLFDTEGAALLPLLTQGAAGIEELRARARELGIVMNEAAIKDLVEFKDAMGEIRDQIGATGREVAVGFLPILREDLIPFIQAGVLPRIKEWTGALGELDGEQVKVIASTAGIAAAIGPVLFGFGSLIRTGSTLIQTAALLAGAKAALGAVLIPGGVLLAGLALLAGAFIKTQIEALKTAGEIAALRAELEAMSDEQRQAHLEQLQTDFANAGRALTEARENLAAFNEELASRPERAGSAFTGVPEAEELVALQRAVEDAQGNVAGLAARGKSPPSGMASGLRMRYNDACLWESEGTRSARRICGWRRVRSRSRLAMYSTTG